MEYYNTPPTFISPRANHSTSSTRFILLDHCDTTEPLEYSKPLDYYIIRFYNFSFFPPIFCAIEPKK